MVSPQHRTGIRIDGDAQGVVTASRTAGQAIQSLDERVTRMSDSMRRLGQAGIGLYALKQVFDWGRRVTDTADQMATLASRIKLVTSSTEQQLQVQSRLFDVAQAARLSYAELGGTYAQIARASSSLGLSQERLLGVVQSISQAMTIGGGSADSMRAALVQLSQGLASGTLRGEELNSILEQAPRLAQAIAEGMGVGVGKLRELGAEGKLQATQIIGALENQAGVLQAEFGQVRKTIGGGMTEARNAIALLIGNLSDASGAGAALADSLGGLARSITALARSRESLEALGTALKAAATAAAAFAAVGLGRLLAAKALALKEVITGTIAYVTALHAQTAAANAAAVAEGRIAAARTTAATAAALGARALGFLGGPIGAVTTLLGLGATAWTLWGGAARAGERAATTELHKSTQEVIADLEQQIAKLRERNELARLATKGGVEPSAPYALDFARAQKAFTDAVTGQGQYANLRGAARDAVIKSTGAQLGRLAERLRELRAEQDAVSLGAGGDKAGEWMERYASRAEKLQAELQRARNELGAHFTPELEQRIRDRFAEPATERAGNDRLRVYRQIREELDQQKLLADAELAQGRQLSQTESERLRTLQEISRNQAELGPRLAAELRARVDLRAATAEQVEQSRARAAAAEQEREARRREGQAALQRAAGMHEENRALAAEVEQIGLNGQALYELEQRRLSETLAAKEQRLETLARGPTWTMEAAALREEIDLLRERGRLLSQRRARTATQEAADAAVALRKREEEEAQRRSELLADSISNGILDGVRAGESLMKVFTDELEAQFARTVLRPVIQPMVEATNSVVSMLLNKLVGAAGGLFGAPALSPGMTALATVWHGGGRVGADAPARQQLLPASVWAGAPRLHGGLLAPDEYPAILQRGESVLTPGQMAQLAPAAPTQLQVTLVNQSGVPLQAQAQPRADGGVDVILSALKDAIAGDIGAGTGPIPRALQGRYGLRPAFASM